MQLLSINIGKAENLGTLSKTGIFKHPALGAVHIGKDGIKGDDILDTKHHGGPDQAIYIYCQPDYDYWTEQLGTPMTPGLFGENLTISKLTSADLYIGDRLTIGDLVLEVTAPRVPCNVLAARMGDKYFVKTFNKANRSGAYMRVITPGTVTAGDKVSHTPFEGERVATTEMLANHTNPDPLTIARYLATPLAERMKVRFEQKA
jgi:MOSC domain-containing protein YiiM